MKHCQRHGPASDPYCVDCYKDERERTASGPLDAATCSRSSIVDFIRRYNRWRRGDESLTMESPKAIGEALDAVCDILDEHANEIQGWKNKWKWAVEMAARAEVERDELREILYQVSTVGYTPMAAHEWLQSHRENAIGEARADNAAPHPPKNL